MSYSKNGDRAKSIPNIVLTKQDSVCSEISNNSAKSIDLSSVDELSDDGCFNNNGYLESGYLEPLQTDDRYLEPVFNNKESVHNLRGPLIDVDSDDNLRITVETNRYFDLNQKWDPNVKHDCLQLFNSYMETEDEYMVILKIINHEYIDNLKFGNNLTDVLNDPTLQSAFKNLHDIYKVHENLFKELEERAQNWQNKPCIFDIMTKYLPDFQLYDNYINNFENSFQALIKYATKSESFAEYLKNRNNYVKRTYLKILGRSGHNFSDSLDLKSCFIHILKWPDCCAYFLKAYISYLSEDSHELTDLMGVFENLSELSKKATEIIADSLRVKALINLQKRLGSKYNIVNKKRNILKEGVLTSVKKYLGMTDKFHVILLNDMLIICDYSNEALKPKYLLDAIGLRIYDDINASKRKKSPIKLPNGLKADNGFLVYVPCIKKKFRFIARNRHERDIWFHEFEIVESANKYQEEINRSNLGKIQPKWIPDNLCQYCCKCKAEFTTLNRRHHCRACGYIFCSKCSKMQANLEYDENKRSRICDICYDHISGLYRCGPPSKEEVNRRLTVKL